MLNLFKNELFSRTKLIEIRLLVNFEMISSTLKVTPKFTFLKHILLKQHKLKHKQDHSKNLYLDCDNAR